MKNLSCRVAAFLFVFVLLPIAAATPAWAISTYGSGVSTGGIFDELTSGFWGIVFIIIPMACLLGFSWGAFQMMRGGRGIGQGGKTVAGVCLGLGVLSASPWFIELGMSGTVM